MYVKSFVQCILTYLTLKPSLSIQGSWPNILAHLGADKQEDIRRVPEPAALVSPPNSDKPTSTRPLHFHHYTVWWRSDPKNKREEEVSIKKTFDQLEVLWLQLSTFFHNRWIWQFFSGHREIYNKARICISKNKFKIVLNNWFLHLFITSAASELGALISHNSALNTNCWH